MTPAPSGSKTRRLAFSRFFAQTSKRPASYQGRRYQSISPNPGSDSLQTLREQPISEGGLCLGCLVAYQRRPARVSLESVARNG